ncbi:hypothetical protein NIES4074_62870 (plasmid) [Cylindrospermum sp. NIES-4074]|nr:hypothetical protein NIES4074_62870 [Cylindrospermum sp. NIES-4074]
MNAKCSRDKVICRTQLEANYSTYLLKEGIELPTVTNESIYSIPKAGATSKRIIVVEFWLCSFVLGDASSKCFVLSAKRIFVLISVGKVTKQQFFI